MTTRRLTVLVAAILIGIGGIGVNTIDAQPAKLLCGLSLALGIIIYAIFLFRGQRNRA